MNQLVIEQGTIMDRIDYNIFDAKYQIHQAKEELNKTYKKESSIRASACIVCLV